MAKLIGYKKFKSKAGSPICFAFVQEPAGDFDIKYGYVGDKVSENFIPESLHKDFTPDKIGMDIDFGFHVSAGRAYIDSVSFS